MLLDARWVGGLVYFVINITLTLTLLCLIAWLVYLKSTISPSDKGSYWSLAVSGALAALLQTGSVLISVIGLGDYTLNNHQGKLPALDESQWGTRGGIICATEGVTAAYSRAVLITHLLFLAHRKRQEALNRIQSSYPGITYLPILWLYGSLPAISLTATFGISRFDTTFFAWNGLRCMPNGLWWRIAHVAFLGTPTLATLYLSFVTLLHLACAYDSPERKGIAAHLLIGCVFGCSGSLMTYLVFEQVTWGEDTWVRALQAAEPLAATGAVSLWVLQHADCGSPRRSDARRSSHTRVPSNDKLGQEQRRSSFFAPVLTEELVPRPPSLAIPPRALAGSCVSPSYTSQSEEPFHFDDLSRASSSHSPMANWISAWSKASGLKGKESDTASSIYSLPSYRSQGPAASSGPERQSGVQSVTSLAKTHFLRIQDGLPTRETSDAPRAVDRFGKGMI